MTISASRTPRVVSTRQPGDSGDSPVTRVANSNVTPRSRAWRMSPSRTSRARSDTGKYLPASSSSLRGIPKSFSKNDFWCSSGHDRSSLPHELGRRVRDESFGLKRARQHVAPAAAADEDFAPAVGRALEHGDRPAPAARADRGHQAGRAGANNDDRPHRRGYFRISSAVTTRTGPRFASRIGFSIFARSPTTTTANLSLWMYCAAAFSTSAAVVP